MRQLQKPHDNLLGGQVPFANRGQLQAVLISFQIGFHPHTLVVSIPVMVRSVRLVKTTA